MIWFIVSCNVRVILPESFLMLSTELLSLQVVMFIRASRETHSGELVLIVRPNGKRVISLVDLWYSGIFIDLLVNISSF